MRQIKRKALHLSVFAIATVIAAALFFSSDNPITVSAQRGDNARRASRDTKVARADMLGIALDLRSAGDHTVFAQKGIRGDGVANLSGKSGTGSDEASLGEKGSGLKARSDLTKSFSAINQLPCEELDGELTGGSFKPGVYCAPSATLSQQMILDAGGDSNGIFIFRTSGSMKTAEGFQMTLENGTTPGNVFFVSGDTASIADFGSISGSVIARNTITVGKGATVNGRALSKDGEVILGESSNLVLQEGVIEICKEAVAPVVSTPPITLHGTSEAGEAGLAMVQGPSGLENRIFQFRLNGQIYQVPVGGCSGPITVPAGPTLIEELIDGTFTNQAGTWNNRFRLVRVERSGPSTLGAINLPLRTAVVNVVQGTISSQTVVTFFNQFAIPAVIEICKYPAAPTAIDGVSVNDTDVTGFFDFTVDALPNQIFPVPVGQCSGAIQVQPVANPGAFPQESLIRVTEIAENGYTLDSASTFPANRFGGLTLNAAIRNTIACSTIGEGLVPPACVDNTNSGGGYVTGTVVEGGTENQTTFNFFNRTNPGVLKVCKIAGPGIPIGTRFDFEIRGRAPSNPFPGPIMPGIDITRIVRVMAGPATQGGYCTFVRETNNDLTRFIVGSNVLVTELLPAVDPIPGVGPGEVRVSRIRLNQALTGFPAAPVTVQGITVTPNPNLLTRQAVYRQRRGTSEIEYTNFVFQPTTLKICKIAGPGISVGASFTFQIAIQNTGGFPFGNQTNQPITVPNLTVLAGPASSGGFCAFAQGPFTPTNTTPPVGTFPVGATVTVTESPAPGTGLVSVTSPTGTPVVDLLNRTANLTLGFPGGFNELVFTNNVGGGLESDVANRFTGDGVVLSNDVVLMRQFAVGLLTPNPAFNEFQRADAAPRATLGDGMITSGDVIQARRYAVSLDPPTPAGGPIGPIAPVMESPLAAAGSADGRVVSAFTAYGCAGFQTTVEIMLESEGNEAAAGLTVKFDPAILSDPQILLGEDTAAGGFVLTTNPTNVANGEIGILIDAPDAFPAAPSKRHLVNIRFQVVPGAPTGLTEIGFGGKTTLLSTADALGNLLETSYQPGNISIGGQACTTSSGVTLSGRVLSPEGTGLRNATVVLTDTSGKSRTVTSNSLGYYQINDVRTGQTYVIGVSNKRFRFDSRVIQVTDAISNIDLVGIE